MSSVPSYEEWRVKPSLVAPADSPIRAHHNDLPHLPVPELSSTMTKALRACEAIAADAQEMQELKRKAQDFTSKEGPALQKRLQEKAAKSANWLAKDWDQLAYMTYRSPVVINVSYTYGFSKLPQASQNTSSAKDDPAYVAATIVSYAADYRDRLIKGDIIPDEAGGAKQDMSSFNWLFNACRIPAEGSDYAVKLSDNDPLGDFVVAIRNHHFYKVPITGKDGKRASVDALRKAFQEIYDKTPQEQAPALGMLTAADRDLWTKARTHLIDSPTNVESLKAIEQSIAVVCLDDRTPSSKDDGRRFSRLLLYGEGNDSRWFDKPMQWVIFDNGESGIIGEHSVMDGTPTARLNNEMTLALMAYKNPPVANPSSQPVAVEQLSFEIDDTTNGHIKAAAEQHQKAIDGQELEYLDFQKYGKEAIKKQKVSPDGWVQMVMQLAYALTYNGQVAATYESASTRRFVLGRTETVRVCTPESKAWVDAMLDKTSNDDTRRRLFRTAVAQHGKDMKDASAAMGADRHLLGLKLCVDKSDSMPAFLSDGLLARSGKWLLSTSQVFGALYKAYTWGQVTEEGFGLPYMILPDSLLFTVNSRVGLPAKELTSNIQKALQILMDLMSSAPPTAKL